MRRKEKQLSREATAAVLANAEYGNLASIDDHGRPYVIPMSFAVDADCIYLHCAVEGSKLSNIKSNPEVGFSAVGKTKVLPGDFSTAYESAVVQGRAVIVESNEEKRKGLMLLAQKYSAGHMEAAPPYIDKSFDRVCVIRIDIYKVAGKASKRELLN